MIGARDDRDRLSERYERMAQLCIEYADDAADPTVRQELMGMAEFYRSHAQRDAKDIPSNAVPPPAEEFRSAFRFADLGRTPGLGAQSSSHGSD